MPRLLWTLVPSKGKARSALIHFGRAFFKFKKFPLAGTLLPVPSDYSMTFLAREDIGLYNLHQ